MDKPLMFYASNSGLVINLQKIEYVDVTENDFTLVYMGRQNPVRLEGSYDDGSSDAGQLWDLMFENEPLTKSETKI